MEALIRAVRVRGSALSAVARADLSIVRDELMLPMRQAGANDLTMAVALSEATEALEEVGRQALVHAYEAQLDAQLDGQLVAMAARSAREEVDIAVGSLDVEGYTALSSRIDPAGLDAVIEAFEWRVLSVTSDVADVSPVKYLGDAVMLVAADAGDLAEVMLDLTRPVEDLADAPLRGGMAAGSVLAADDLEEQLAGRFELRRIRPVKVRGVGRRRPLALQARRDD